MKKILMGLTCVVIIAFGSVSLLSPESKADVTVGDLTATVTSIPSTLNTAGKHLNVVEVSTGRTVIDKDYRLNFSPTEGLNSAQEAEVTKRMQKDIALYKVLKAIDDSPAMNNANGRIENNLNL